MKKSTAILFSSTAAIIFTILFSLVGVSPSQATPLAPGRAQIPMPDELLGAFLPAASQPFEPGPAGYSARSGGLNFTLNASGLQASGEGLSMAIALNGFGRGEQMAALPEAELTHNGSHLEYRRGALTEWYRDTPLGIEQGFTIHQPPDGAGPLVLTLNLSGPLAVVADPDGRGLSFTSPNRPTLRYDHLRAWDAGGAPLEAKLASAQGQIRLWVNDQGADYPITVDPLIYAEQKVSAPEGAAFDRFGCSVAVSGDTALVGALYDDLGPNGDQGSAYVFTRSGGIWSLQQKLTAPDGGPSDFFGAAVALDGDTALVTAYSGDVDGKTDQGSAYVFTRNAGAWTMEQKLTAPDGAVYLAFGASVALDGDTALVGTIGANYDLGSVYVFTRGGTTWSMQQKLLAPDGSAYRAFGVSVALAGDTALVGAFSDDISGKIDQGSAYVFTRGGTTWSLQQKLTAPGGTNYDFFGYSVALAGDTALVGAYGSAVAGKSAAGSAYVFTRSGATWSLQQKLAAADGAFVDRFGYAVALDEDTALVGAYFDSVGPNYAQGSAYVFTRGGEAWSQQQKLTASDGAASDHFGAAVALSGDTALVGALYDAVDENLSQGSAHIFTRNGGATWTHQAHLIATGGAADDLFGVSVALEGDTALVGAQGEKSNQGAVYVFTRSAGTWNLQQKLTAADGAADSYFGHSVTLAGDTALVGAFWDDVDGHFDQGAVYVFTRSAGTWSLQQKLTAADGAARDYFGVSVALSGDTALVGAFQANSYFGSAYVFTHDGATWSQQQKLTAPDGAAFDHFGFSAALAGDTALVGASKDDVGANSDQGSAYVFTRGGTTWSLQQKLTANDGASDDYFGYAVALAGDTALVGAYADDVGTNFNQGSAYAFTRSGTTWTQQAQLTAADGAANDNFGYAVALSDETALVGAFGVDEGRGSAYLFTRGGEAWKQKGQLTASDGMAHDLFGNSAALSGNTALVGASHDNIGQNSDQGSAHFYEFRFPYYLPLIQQTAP